MSRQRQEPQQISRKLNQSLLAYAAAASAAGVGTLSFAQPAEAKIVYTATNTTIPENGQVLLDLNHDGANDFSFSQFSYGGWEHFYFSPLVKGNGALNAKQGAAALRAGVPIGPKGSFEEVTGDMLAKWGGTSGYSQTSGNWNEVTNRYLGLRFLVNGETHYGWARLTVTGKGGIGATLTGYAYETIPNKRILSGQTVGTDSQDISTNNLPAITHGQGTLGTLSSGYASMDLWRREENAVGS